MKKLLSAILLGCAFGSLTACTAITAQFSSPEKTYEQAVSDAALVRENEISTQLIAIDDKNADLVWNADKTKILVVTWKEQAAYEKFLKPNHNTSNNPDYATWVTVAPQVQQFCQNYLAQNAQAAKPELDLRLKQYLGLNAAWNYDVFIEMWVSPKDLFRPCVDPEINDSECRLQFGESAPQVKNIPDYVGFYKNLYFKSFRASGGVPWTGLGYTYDWGNAQSPVGASEFILVPEADYQIKRVVATHYYCKIN